MRDGAERRISVRARGWGGVKDSEMVIGGRWRSAKARARSDKSLRDYTNVAH